jgi:hypothetical protein
MDDAPHTDAPLPDDQQEDEADLAGPQINFDAVVTASDWTTQTILSQLEKGNINLNPDFQRRQAWRAARKSQFIESLILGIPVPQLVLAERRQKKGSYIVIDGKQRLLTLLQFTAKPGSEFEPFALSGLPIREDLNGKSYLDLEEDPLLNEDITNFENQTIRTVVIRNWKDENFLYTVFLRLNTGSVPLSPQELRQALHPGEFSKFVFEYSADSKLLQQVLGLEEPDFRMRDAELVIRYFAFRNFLATYTGNLKPLLDHTTARMNEIMKEDPRFVNDQVADFETALSTAIQIFGEKNAFRKWTETKYERSFNRAIFDALAISFSDPDVAERAVRRREEVEGLFKQVCDTDVRFRTAVEGTTKSIDSIVTRLGIWAGRLANQLGMPVRGARLVDGRIVVERLAPT